MGENWNWFEELMLGLSDNKWPRRICLHIGHTRGVCSVLIPFRPLKNPQHQSPAPRLLLPPSRWRPAFDILSSHFKTETSSLLVTNDKKKKKILQTLLSRSTQITLMTTFFPLDFPRRSKTKCSTKMLRILSIFVHLRHIMLLCAVGMALSCWNSLE